MRAFVALAYAALFFLASSYATDGRTEPGAGLTLHWTEATPTPNYNVLSDENRILQEGDRLRARVALEAAIKSCTGVVAGKQAETGGEPRVGEVSGYEDRAPLHEQGNLVVDCESTINAKFSEYRMLGGQRSLAEVQAGVSPSPDELALLQRAEHIEKMRKGRTLRDVQLVFDQYKGAITAIYHRAARDDKTIADGKVVVRLTIEEDGTLSACKLVSSTLNNPTLESQLLRRISQMTFGVKIGPALTVEAYPIYFLPRDE